MKNSGGQATFKGLNAQVSAAFSLFLQFMKDNKFSYIHLEPPKCQDFNLVFDNGKKIICESKEEEKPFNFLSLRKILENLYKNWDINSEDEILIICKNLSKKLDSAIKNFKIFNDEQIFRDKGFSEAIQILIKKVNFWETSKLNNDKIMLSLLSEKLGFWLPTSEVDKIKSDTLLKNFYRKSANGFSYTKEEFFQNIEQYKNDAKNNSVLCNKAKGLEKIFKDLIIAAENPNGDILTIPKEISAISTEYEFFIFTVNRLKNIKNVALNKWHNFWQLTQVPYFSSLIFDVFENNMNSDENIEYIIKFCKENASKTQRYYYKFDSLMISIIKILIRIIDIEHSVKRLNDIFDILSILITLEKDEFFYLKRAEMSDERQFEQEQVCELAYKIYESGDVNLKNKIATLLVSNFKLIEDYGTYIFYTPRKVFNILKMWLTEDYENRLLHIIAVLINQYQKLYQNQFKGWESRKQGISNFNDNFYIDEYCFVKDLLLPATTEYYNSKEIIGWEFIKKHCIIEEKKVRKNKPDFLNRATFEVLLLRYKSNNVKISDEAYIYLKSNITTKRSGYKSDLLSQMLIHEQDLSTEKKWKLVELSINKKNSSLNVFHEKLLAELACKKLTRAENQLENLYDSKEYYERSGFVKSWPSTIRLLLQDNFQFGVELLKKMILNPYNEIKYDIGFNAYSVADLIRGILKKNYQQGLSLLETLNNEKKLNESQQIIYTASFFDPQDHNNSIELLLRLYDDVIDPLLNRYNTNKKLLKRFTNSQSRSLIVQYAEKLAINKQINKSLRIVYLFVNDPDPSQQMDYILNGKEPLIIDTVRGRCGWVLSKCINLAGREQIDQVIELTKILLTDINYYVLHMGCYALAQLANVRLSVLPSDNTVLFFNDDRKTALLMSKEIESLAFQILDKFIQWEEPIKKSMMNSILFVFDKIRTLTENEAYKLLTTIAGSNDEIISKAASFFIYYAEIRKNAYKNWTLSLPGLYDHLHSSEFNARIFKNLLVDVIAKLQNNKPDLCFNFATNFGTLLSNNNAAGYDLIVLEYYILLSKIYNDGVFKIIYHSISEKFDNSNVSLVDKKEWYVLFIKCLNIEKDYHIECDTKGSLSSFIYHDISNILISIHNKIGTMEFIEAVKIFFSFPDKIKLNESQELVHLLETMSSESEYAEIAKGLKKSLLVRNPVKYYGNI